MTDDNTKQSPTGTDDQKNEYNTDEPSIPDVNEAPHISENETESTIRNGKGRTGQHYTEIGDVSLQPQTKQVPSIALLPTLPARPAQTTSITAFIHVSDDGYMTPRSRSFQTSRKSTSSLPAVAEESESTGLGEYVPMSGKASLEEVSVGESGGLNVVSDDDCESNPTTCESKCRPYRDGIMHGLESALTQDRAKVFMGKRYENIRPSYSERNPIVDSQGSSTTINSEIEIDYSVRDPAKTSSTYSDGEYVKMRKKSCKGNEEQGMEKTRKKSILSPIKQLSDRLSEITSIRGLKLTQCFNDKHQNCDDEELDDLAKRRETLNNTYDYTIKEKLPLVPDNVNAMQCLHKSGDFNKGKKSDGCRMCEVSDSNQNHDSACVNVASDEIRPSCDMENTM